jgi:anti-anti-sigma regulatory factor
MKLATMHTSTGSVITIETDEELDLRSHGVFVHACKLAEHPDAKLIEVNLGKTRSIRDSGLAMLLMLCEQTGWESDRVRVINCSPEIRRRLVANSTVTRFSIA